jgi:hypothetical protein
MEYPAACTNCGARPASPMLLTCVAPGRFLCFRPCLWRFYDDAWAKKKTVFINEEQP